MRSLYWDIHRDEFSKGEVEALDKYHNLNEVHRYVVGEDYSDYFTYIFTRNPYSRIVSAFLDQYVYLRNAQVKKMLSDFPYENAQEPQNFIEFLEYLKTIPDGQRDSHFQTQAFTDFADLIVTPANLAFRFAGMKHQHAFGVKYVGDISEFNRHTTTVFKRIFKKDKAKHDLALSLLAETKKRNTSFYGTQDYENAALLSIKELAEMHFAPKPQDFYADSSAVDLVNEIYRDDFKWFKYTMGEIPQKRASKEVDLVPEDLDWQTYIKSVSYTHLTLPTILLV